VFICNWIKKRQAEGKQCYVRTLHVPLRQSAGERRQGKELRVL
jgi:hypothetical protein